MTPRRILVVDDELINLEIIQAYLEDSGHELDLTLRAEDAWDKLVAATQPHDLVILDRMMPGMNGIELLKRIKADARFAAIPVVMQTAATAPDQVREGIEAGAYYYLAKPYEPGTLLAIVRAALVDLDVREYARQAATAQVRAMALLDNAEFRFRTLNEVGPLIQVLASLCAEPQTVASGLNELLVNAVEHGNLGISYDEKKRLRMADTWEAEVVRRLALPGYRDRQVRVRVARRPDQLEFTISDEGAGFDWQRYLAIDPARATDPNGRGIAMARMLSFANLHYGGNGNTVVATVRT
jgi:DNA-binding response OmpR family regulator/anti-sigma regulatory factor (Ser/Thr protein kinase)